jgi:hypothetical protein
MVRVKATDAWSYNSIEQQKSGDLSKAALSKADQHLLVRKDAFSGVAA